VTQVGPPKLILGVLNRFFKGDLGKTLKTREEDWFGKVGLLGTQEVFLGVGKVGKIKSTWGLG